MRIKDALVNFLIVIFSIVCIELILILAGATHHFFFSPKNVAVQSTKNEKVVLCIGESTTAWGLSDSYPSQLQALLDIKYGKNIYRVINAGAPGADTTKIYKNLDDLVNKYKPEYVIAMMGINDIWSISEESSFLDSFRVYRFLKIFKDYIKAYAIEKKAEEHRKNYDGISSSTAVNTNTSLKAEAAFLVKLPVEVYWQLIQNAKQVYHDQAFKKINKEFSKIQVTEYLRIQDFYKLVDFLFKVGNKNQVQKVLWQVAKSNNDFKLFREIGKSYLIKYGIADTYANEAARKFFIAALKIDPNDEESMLHLSRSYSNEARYYELALELAKKSFDKGSRNPDLISIMAEIYKNTNRDQLAIPFIKAGLYSGNKSEIWLWVRLIEIYIKSGDRENTEKYLKLAYEKYPGNAKFNEVEIKYRNKFSLSTDQLKSYTVKNFYEHPATQNNYKKIANYLANKNINLIIMQYPLRPVEPIKDLLSDYSKIQYVENYTEFELASKKIAYKELFLDRFAEDFGHFTPTSAKIIAQNIMQQVNFSSKE